jgi:hypothetical protein
MKSDGSGRQTLASGREPHWDGGIIYFIGRDTLGIGIFAMSSKGISIIKQVSQPEGNTIDNIRTWNGYLFYQLGSHIYKGKPAGIFSPISSDPIDQYGFDVSPDGKVAFVLYDGRVNSIQGTIWIMNADGTNKKQLTHNSF